MAIFSIKKSLIIVLFLLAFLCTFFLLQVYTPISSEDSPAIVYDVKAGDGYKIIAQNLADQMIIKSKLFFELHVLLSGKYSKLQAGKYYISPSMSIAEMAEKFYQGDVAKQQLLTLPGWTIYDIAQYLQDQNFTSKENFLNLASQNFNKDFNFLGSKPNGLTLEGYLFPDKYYVTESQDVNDLMKAMLVNFGSKLTPELRIAIAAQHKSIFQIVTMASILEKEVRSIQDKKIVSGILWKRLVNGMPLQVDATLDYAGRGSFTNKVAKDSSYNTYKYIGLPGGPISNPGLESIIAAVYPEKSDFWYYLSAKKTGKTIFSKTFLEHQAAIIKYLHN